jgi:hypothetical protein
MGEGLINDALQGAARALTVFDPYGTAVGIAETNADQPPPEDAEAAFDGVSVDVATKLFLALWLTL